MEVAAALVLFVGSLLGYGLATGRMPAKTAFYGRKKDPFWYWATAALYIGLIAFIVYMSVQ